MALPAGQLSREPENDLSDQDERGPLTDKEWTILRTNMRQSLPAGVNDNELPDILLKHQKELLNSVSQFSLTATDKSRRVGATWALGSVAVLTAGAAENAGGMDVLYLGYNLDMAREFIDTCGMWARAFMPACSEVGEFLFEDRGENGQPDKFIQAFRIRFASGFEIVALSSAPRSLRGRQGLAILDEFAFHDDAEQLLKAAMAFTIWGGKVVVVSTHNGADNDFNKLLEDIRKGEYGDDANVVRCTFDDAVANGLYERVCLRKGIEWTAEGEAKWRANIRRIYRHNAAEELDCIPSEGSGVYMTRAEIEACASIRPPEVVTFIAPPGFVLKPEDYRLSYMNDWLDQHVKPLLDRLDPKLQHAFGEDFAESGDCSVQVPLEIGRDLTRRAPFVIELRNCPYEQQKQCAIYVCDALPRLVGIKPDATGNGGYLGQVLLQRYGENIVETVKLSQTWYMENMPKMKDAIEGKRLLFPANDNLVSDMRMVKLVRGVPKVPANDRSEGSDGFQRHGDFAVALCLAYAASLNDALTYDGFQLVGGPKEGRGGFERDEDHDFDSDRFGGSRAWG